MSVVLTLGLSFNSSPSGLRELPSQFPTAPNYILICTIQTSRNIFFFRKFHQIGSGKRCLQKFSLSLSLATVEDLELVALVGGEEGGDVAEALG